MTILKMLLGVTEYELQYKYSTCTVLYCLALLEFSTRGVLVHEYSDSIIVQLPYYLYPFCPTHLPSSIVLDHKMKQCHNLNRQG
jgi:hypothetical protein